MKRILIALILCLSFAAPSFGAVLKQRGDTAANWTSNNPTLAAREVGWETDTRKFKLGDGATAWTSLAYVSGSTPTSLSGVSLTNTTYPSSASTSTATGNINIDGASADHYYFSNGASAATYTPVITSAPASGFERAIVLTVGGGAGVVTMTWTNVSFIGTTGATTTTANKYNHYACLIKNTGNALCKIIAEASDH